MNRLFRAKISFDVAQEASNGDHGSVWLDMQVAPKGELWWSHRTPNQDTLWQSWIELGEHFFEAIISAPVPLRLDELPHIHPGTAREGPIYPLAKLDGPVRTTLSPAEKWRQSA
jgi:hypothetical protein